MLFRMFAVKHFKLLFQMQRISIFLWVILLVSCKNQVDHKLSNNFTCGKKPKNIILLIGDGMGVAQIYAGYTANKGHLNIERCTYSGFSKTFSASNYVTDSGAGATAIATGKKTKNGCVGTDSLGNVLKTILEYAEDNGKATGLISTSSITDATPAAFIAHEIKRDSDECIAFDFLKTDIDVFIGGGQKYFMKRHDKRNLLDSLTKRGYQVLFSMDKISRVTSGKLAGLTAYDNNPKYTEGRGDMLPNAASTAINILGKNEKGFFLMVEGSMIDWACHENDATYLINEMLDFDRTLGKALDFAAKDGNTLVIVTADHETSGVSIIDGNYATGDVSLNFAKKNATSISHTGVMVPVFAFGPGAEHFTGIFNNTAIFEKMMMLFQFKK
jgi:alkaline phosphatase